jgi:hypothetical protein
VKRTQHKLSYASPGEVALIRLKFDGPIRALYDRIDREARKRDCSRQFLIFEILAREFPAIKNPGQGGPRPGRGWGTTSRLGGV